MTAVMCVYHFILFINIIKAVATSVISINIMCQHLNLYIYCLNKLKVEEFQKII